MRGVDITIRVANISLEGPKSDAVAAAINAGLVIVVAAARSSGDSSPASEPIAYTIESIKINEAKSSFSSYGARMIPLSPFYKLSASRSVRSSISLLPQVTSLSAGSRLAEMAQGSSVEPL